MAIIHPVGDPVDNCERKVISYLKTHLPDTFHVYHNLELIPRRGGHPYEYDLIVVGQRCVWVGEVKDYRGTIRGNARTWELANGRFERSPIPLTNNKARILKSSISSYAPRLRNQGNGVYVDALVILCDACVKIDLTDPQVDRVVRLSELSTRLITRELTAAHTNPSRDEGSTIRRMLDQRFGPWSVERRIGEYVVDGSSVSRGKHSVTYLARHAMLRSRNRVSLKVYRLDTSLPNGKLERRKAMFLRDAEVLNILSEHPHKNLVRCYAPFTWKSDRIALPMEWVDGPTLRDLLDEGLDWSFRHRLTIFRQICAGLAYAHRCGIVHRALSPDNIVLLQGATVKIVNFKLAKVEYDTMFTLSTVGTQYFHSADRRYPAPEARKNPHKATPRSDIFSAGVVLFELMTGRCPFSQHSQIRSDMPLDRPSGPTGSLPSDIDDIYLQMCCFDPDQRCASMEDVLDLIDAAVIS